VSFTLLNKLRLLIIKKKKKKLNVPHPNLCLSIFVIIFLGLTNLCVWQKRLTD
jgi:hypothetical protein